jgi:hypothetical protein
MRQVAHRKQIKYAFNMLVGKIEGSVLRINYESERHDSVSSLYTNK